MSETQCKVELLPGITMTPRMLLAQVLGDADSLKGVLIVTVEKPREGETSPPMTLCLAGMSCAELAMATKIIDREIDDRLDELGF